MAGDIGLLLNAHEAEERKETWNLNMKKIMTLLLIIIQFILLRYLLLFPLSVGLLKC